ncbi:MAG: hypothetical protein II625_00770 [Bacilli bacterium]|nr:hypothetical protein [Bacilli bacterium]
MDYDFAVDTAKIDSLISVINGNITQIDNMIKQLYEECAYPLNKLDSLNYWKGEVYTAFKNGTNGAAGLKTNLDNALTALKAFVDVLNTAKTEASNLTSESE